MPHIDQEGAGIHPSVFMGVMIRNNHSGLVNLPDLQTFARVNEPPLGLLESVQGNVSATLPRIFDR